MSTDLRSTPAQGSPIDSLISRLSSLVEEESLMIANLEKRTDPICIPENAVAQLKGEVKSTSETSQIENQINIVVDRVRADLDRLQSIISRLRI